MLLNKPPTLAHVPDFIDDCAASSANCVIDLAGNWTWQLLFQKPGNGGDRRPG